MTGWPQVHETARVSPSAVFYGDPQNLRIGPHCRIDDGCILTGTITLEAYNHLAPYCVLYGKSGISIGAYSGFGPYTAMHSESDDYTGQSMFGPQVPDEYRPHVVRRQIIIAPHVLCGTRVTILPGVSIGEGAALGAHSLMNRDCLPWTIYAGTPAVAVGSRRQADYLSLCRRFEAELGASE